MQSCIHSKFTSRLMKNFRPLKSVCRLSSASLPEREPKVPRKASSFASSSMVLPTMAGSRWMPPCNTVNASLKELCTCAPVSSSSSSLSILISISSSSASAISSMAFSRAFCCFLDTGALYLATALAASAAAFASSSAPAAPASIDTAFNAYR